MLGWKLVCLQPLATLELRVGLSKNLLLLRVVVDVVDTFVDDHIVVDEFVDVSVDVC